MWVLQIWQDCIVDTFDQPWNAPVQSFTVVCQNIYSGAQKSESSFFFCIFGFSFIYILFFSLNVFFFNIFPTVHVRKCSMHFIISYYVVCPRIFFFQFCFNSARHGVFKFSDHFFFYIFQQSLITSHMLFRLVGLFTFFCFKCSQKRLFGFTSGN